MGTDRTERLFGDESVRAWQSRDYAIIIEVAHKISDKVLQEDAKVLMWYDQAITRSGENE